MPRVFPFFTLFPFFAFAIPALAEDILLPKGEATTWRYLDTGSGPERGWKRAAFEDADWKSGAAPLGYANDDIKTTVSFGDDPRKKHITTYFRTRFTVDETRLDSLETLVFKLRADDGAALYLNGRELLRSNLPAGRIDRNTLASVALSDDVENEYLGFIVPASVLDAGPNVLAVEVHQGSSSSSDLCLDLEIAAYQKGETPEGGYFNWALQAARQNDFSTAIRLFALVPETDSNYVDALRIAGYELYAKSMGQPERGLPLVKKAYQAQPEDMEVVRAYIRTRVLARRGLTIDTTRKHATKLNPDFAFIASDIVQKPRGERISREEMLEDIDYLEEMMANCYSYLERTGVDWKSALDTLRLSVKDGMSTGDLVLRIAKFLTLFGDGHSRVSYPKRSYVPGGFGPWIARRDQERVVFLKPDLSDFLEKDFPYVREIDGKSIARWLQVGGYLVPRGSPQLRAAMQADLLGYVNYIRAELKLPREKTVSIVLESTDRSKSKTVSLELLDQRPRDRSFLQTKAKTLPGEIGYLPIRSMTRNQTVLDQLDEDMASFKTTKGLIIDVRQNGGGTQDVLRRLLPYFMKPGDPMKIVNVAAYRMPILLPKPNPSGFLGLYGRGLHPQASAVWNEEEKKQIGAFLEGFEPGWPFPEGQFSDWHVMAVKREGNPKAYHYTKPVVFLSDGGSFSATDTFLGAFQGLPGVTLMGIPSGGGSGRMQNYVLPNSEIKLVLCQMASYLPNGQLIEGKGIKPDQRVVPALGDFLGKSDAMLDAAVEHFDETP
ncbi:MAG: S41 family peptidase [Verrucomicrobiota bacterium]